MKYELGLCTNLFNLHFPRSSSTDGCNRSLARGILTILQLKHNWEKTILKQDLKRIYQPELNNEWRFVIGLYIKQIGCIFNLSHGGYAWRVMWLDWAWNKYSLEYGSLLSGSQLLLDFVHDCVHFLQPQKVAPVRSFVAKRHPSNSSSNSPWSGSILTRDGSSPLSEFPASSRPENDPWISSSASCHLSGIKHEATG